MIDKQSNSPFAKVRVLDFHTHTLRAHDKDHVMEIVSLHLGQDKLHEYFTIGMHPWWTKYPIPEDDLQRLFEISQNPNCLAIGEIGLDKLKGEPMEQQMSNLQALLQVARQANKPVIIHCVRAFDQLIQIKKDNPAIKDWCIHGYGRHATLASQLIRQGFYLSLMPGMPREKLQSLLEAIPFEKLFLETDSMPETNIEAVYHEAADIKGVGLETLCQQINLNAQAFFKS